MKQVKNLMALLPEALFLGHLDGDALVEAMASFDLFVHPGESETFGQALQEANASGVPVIATGRDGPLDLVRMGIDGWLYRPVTWTTCGCAWPILPEKPASAESSARRDAR